MTRLFLFVAVLATTIGPALAQCTTSWTNAVGGDWNDAANWSGGAIPGPADDACVDLAGTYIVSNISGAAITVNRLTIGGASGAQTLISNLGIAIGAPSTVEANGEIEWRRGYLSGGTSLTNNGLITIRTNFTGAARGIQDLGTVLINEATIEWMEDELHLFDDGALVNNGTIQKTLAAPFAPFMTQGGVNTGSRLFTNNGTIDVQVGRLDLDAESRHVDATLTAASGATLEFGGGAGVTHTFVGTTGGTPDGTIRIDSDAIFSAEPGAILDIGGTGFVWDEAYLFGGETLTNDGLIVIDGNFSGVQRGIWGLGTVLVNDGTIEWMEDELHLFDDGALVNNGTIQKTLAAPFAPFMTQGGVNTGSRLFTNNGTIDVQVGRLDLDAESRHVDATLTAASGATLEFSGGSTVTHTFSGTASGTPDGTVRIGDDAIFAAEAGAVLDIGGTGFVWDDAYLFGGETLTNNGLIVIDGAFSGAQRGIWGLGTVLVNDGTIEWMEDELHLFDDGALVNNGTIQKTLVAVFAPFMTQGGVDTGSRLFTNNGTIDVQVGRLDLDAESRHVGAVLMASASATLDFGGGSSVTHTFAGTTTGAPEGVVQFSGDPSIVPEAGAVWNVGGTGLQWRDAYLYGNETLTNQGLVVFDGTITGNQRGVSGAGTVLANEGTIDWIEDEFYMDADGVLTNSGLLRVLPSIFVSRLLVSGGGTGVFTNTGTVSVEGTTFEVDAPFDHQAGGIIAGDGVIDLAGSTFTHSGDTAPGVSPGILDWRGQPWNAPSGSSLFIEIGGTVVGDDYDQLDVNGAAALDGTLEIIVTSTAGLTVGDTFTILTASRGVTGTFASIAVDGVPGPSFSVAYNANDVALTLDALESPLTLRGQPGWRTLATPFPDLPLGGREFGMLEPVYTAGYVGAQRDQRNNRGTANVFLYDESTGVFAPPFNDDPIGGGVGFWIYVFNDDDSFTPGTQGGFPKPLNASGTPATFPFTIPVTYTPSVVRDPLTTPALGFNLVGNPANEDLDWDDPNWTKTNVSDVLYIYDPKFNDGDGGFRTWNGTTGTLPSGGTIPVGQGFHVETTSADPELVAPTSALLGTQSSFYRLTSGEADLPASAGKTAESSPLLRLHLDALVGGVQRTSEAFVSFEKDAALGFDSRDARLLAAVPGGTHARLYTALGEVHGEEAGTALQISALPAPEEGVLQIDLGAEVLQDGEAADASATISWDALALPEAWSATLTDRQTGEKYDLTAPGSAGLVLAAEEALTVTEADAGTSRATDQSLIDAAVALGEVLPTPKSPQARALKTIAPVASLTSSASPATRFVIEIDPLGALAGETEASLSTVYPNPASRVARLELRLLEETDVQVSVYDVLGRRVAEVQDGVLAAGVHTVEVPVAALAPGTYVVRVDGSGLGKSRQLTVTQ